MRFRFSDRSLKNLEGIDPKLRECVLIAIEFSEIDFSVVEGLRTMERQKQLFEAGASWTMKSYHLIGRAVDLYPYRKGKTDHSDEAYKLLARAMFRASQEIGVNVEWGGFWVDHEDKPHWQLVK